jgi:hypothetical protein
MRPIRLPWAMLAEGERAFREAARFDPSLAMAWWGIALAVGPNINYPPDKKNTGIAAAAVERASASPRSTRQPGSGNTSRR